MRQQGHAIGQVRGAVAGGPDRARAIRFLPGRAYRATAARKLPHAPAGDGAAWCPGFRRRMAGGNDGAIPPAVRRDPAARSVVKTPASKGVSAPVRPQSAAIAGLHRKASGAVPG